MTQSVREREEEYFTLVFKGDLRKFVGNPLKTETPFGVPWAASIGDVCAEADELRERTENQPSPALSLAVEALKECAEFKEIPYHPQQTIAGIKSRARKTYEQITKG